MSRTRFLAPFLFATGLFLAGCPNGGSTPAVSAAAETAFAPEALVGTWKDEGDATYIIDPGPTMRSVVDYEGESFEIQSQGWIPGAYTWTYLVPSTGYVVTMKISSVEGDVASSTWSNANDSGSETLMRQ